MISEYYFTLNKLSKEDSDINIFDDIDTYNFEEIINENNKQNIGIINLRFSNRNTKKFIIINIKLYENNIEIRHVKDITEYKKIIDIIIDIDKLNFIYKKSLIKFELMEINELSNINIKMNISDN